MRRICFFIAAAIAAVIGTVGLGTGVASAHHPVIVGHTVCQTDGSWTVQWTVSNSETAEGRVMTFDSAKVNGVSITLTPGSVAPSGSAAGTSTHTAATDAATLVVNAVWAYVTPAVTDTKTATVPRPEQCVVSTTSTEAPTTTTEAPTTTTTVAEDSTTTAEVTTTVAEVATTLTENRPLVTPAPEAQVEAVQLTNGAVAQTLPSTGAASVPIALVGGALLLMGGLIVIAARRYGTTV